ncbi:DNA-3-methyladenine glycosylase 2 family protein [Piscinibacter sakaiensis]|uniref:DNA-3-methyladenine glycosylase 2 family protein n=1 Tax=Piscinibacter sakaiensis TaxID=1547922 RepID=UPI003AAB2F7D
MDQVFTDAPVGGVDRAAALAAAHSDTYYQALVSRDARFDGRLFVGVSSTGIYCRPICRVRTPKQQNCRFFATAAQAEAARFRPCLKCRPELAPRQHEPWTVMDASRTLARQAAVLLDGWTAAGDASTIADLASGLGVSERHLRRIFLAEHGVTALQYLQTRRLLLAKQLLTETTLPIAQVALASGFRSLRRFNAAFVEHYRLNPGRLRAEGATALAEPPSGIGVQLVYRLPYDRQRLLAFFAQRAIPGIEAVDDWTVRRTLRAGALGGAAGSPAGWIEARFDAAAPRLQLQFSPELLPHSSLLLAAVRRWLDLDLLPDVVDAALADLPGEPGLRLPGSVDGFELAVRAVLGQQVTVAAARTLARRLVEQHGETIVTPWPDVDRLFPAPHTVAGLTVDAIAGLGIIRSRAQAIVALANAWPILRGAMAPGSPAQPLIDSLCALPGIGPWTANYIAMRALGWPDAFPPGDVAVLKAIRQLAGGQPASAATPGSAAGRLVIEQTAEAWRPWRSYAVLRLWNSLQPAGR